MRKTLYRARSLAPAMLLGAFATGAAMAAVTFLGAGTAAPLVPGAVHAQEVVPPPADQPAAPPGGITVTGQGEAAAAPDVAHLNVGVQTEAPSAQEAMAQNSTKMAAVIEALKRAGIPENDLRTSGVSLQPIMTQPRSGEGAPPAVTGYRATNNLTVTVSDVSKTGEVLDAAVTAGANVAGGVRFGLKDETALRRQALERAARAARSEAEALAAALGVQITGVRSAAEESGAGPIIRAEAMLADARSAAVPIQPGQLTVNVRVRVTFNFS